ncbi:SAM-dependent methyltransferase [Streptomyces sp. N2-109]|uniref:SAM-dependent methyltransferase n=1 Tax=Streptomyces gossypii TaxID=2883101 RepID=A0ABT2JUA2_9ACTN|nr:SAM-dependent methyltransferase [Streptomyces gossypii]MCT2591471.1 SAM-dependent methyltransferase [Streptomyces gossypii]
MSEAGFTPEQIDTTTAHPARMYDYYLGGRDNYEVDREAAERVLELAPEIRVSARGNRAFMHRAVRTVVDRGIRQIIDIGTGIPTSPNTHEVARQVSDNVRVVYVDNDPIVATYAGAKLTNEGDAGFVLADIRDPKAIIEHPTIRELIDFDEPVALMLMAVLHFVQDEEGPAGIVAALTEQLPAGSCLALTHITDDFRTEDGVLSEATGVYKKATATLNLRPYDEILPLFEGFELLEPGLVQMPLWRPDGPVPQGAELRQYVGYGGVGVKGGVSAGVTAG